MRHSASRIGRDSRHVHSTEGVCLWQHVQYGRTRTHVSQLSAMQQQSSSQMVGALLIHRPAWVDQHTGGSWLTSTVHRCPKGMAVGGPCDQTAQQYSAETPPNILAISWLTNIQNKLTNFSYISVSVRQPCRSLSSPLFVPCPFVSLSPCPLSPSFLLPVEIFHFFIFHVLFHFLIF